MKFKSKILLVVYLALALFLTPYIIVSSADNPPMPGMPHAFWGTVKNQNGENIPDGTIISATVDSEIYYSTVMNGLYGWNETHQLSNPPFQIEDAENDNDGKTIHFYVGGVDTSQTFIFHNGEETHIDLTIDDGSNGGNGDNNVTPPIPPGESAPVANSGGPYFGCVNRSISFDGSSSTDSDGTIISYEWIFGDGNSGSGITIDHAFSEVGNYIVNLTVTDDDGLTSSDTTTAFIKDDSDDDGWTDEEEERYGSDPFNSSSYPIDTDGDTFPDVVDSDDDNDGLDDNEENIVGSDSLNNNDVTIIIFQEITFYFVDTDADGQPNVYFNKEDDSFSYLEESGEPGIFYVDVDNDNTTWEYIYDSTLGTISIYDESKIDTNGEIENNIIMIIVLLIIIVVILIIIFSKFGKRKSGGKGK
jgi:hypothetical protein